MRFIDREDELALLLDHLARPSAGFFVLYGRRRIGKSALLERALAELPRAAYHVGTRSTVVEELTRLSTTLASAWGLPVLSVQPLNSMEALMALLQGMTGPAVLVLDEFPFLAESDASLSGLLQATWDRHLSRSQLKLVVCGSSVSMMEETFLSPRAPLFGRRTGQLRLGPLPAARLGEWFPWSTAELVELAGLFGGVPGYLDRLSPEADLSTNLERHLLRRGEPLYEEVPFLLREELREPRVYFAILAAVAAGARKFGEISSKVGLDRANLTRYLATLIELGLLEREVPVTEPDPGRSRKGLYRIADAFLATWFTFVHPHRDRLERGRSSEVLASEVVPRLNSYLGLAVQPVLREMLRGVAIVPFDVAFAGRYWSSTAELDIVMLDAERRNAFVAEIKWSARRVPRALVDDLRQRVAMESVFDGLTITYAVVSRSGFVGERDVHPDEWFVDVGALWTQR